MIATKGQRPWAGRWCLCALAFCAMDGAAASLIQTTEGSDAGLMAAVVNVHPLPAHLVMGAMPVAMRARQEGFVRHLLRMTTGRGGVVPSCNDVGERRCSLAPAQRAEPLLDSKRQPQPPVSATTGVLELDGAIRDSIRGDGSVLEAASSAAPGGAPVHALSGDCMDMRQFMGSRLADGSGLWGVPRGQVGAHRIGRIRLEPDDAHARAKPADAPLRQPQLRLRSSERGR
mgnify:CR=1 FL=1